MKRSKVFGFIIISILVTSCKSNENSKALESPPNIIFILTDDLGYGDIGVLYQNQRKEKGKPFHRTPHLDKMAGEGMLLKQHYVPAPVCAPSRASLLRGVHQGNAEIRNNQFDKALPDNHTIASVLKEAGYTTALIGKYGLQGREGNDPESWVAYPYKRGFDHFFGYVRHRDGHNHYPAHKAPRRDPVELYSGDQEISEQLKGCYTTDLFTAETKRWIVEQHETQPETPFFIYLAYDTPHAGLQIAATPYPEGGGLEGGVKILGEADNYINTATEEIDDYIHPDYANQDWPEVHKRHASMVRRIDNGVGDILQLLADLEIADKTLLVFTSDNGPHSESYGYGDYAPVLFDSFGDFDGIKRDTWEGGVRTPMIVRWPGRIPAGTENNTASGFHDWLPTFAELAGIPAPNTDGISLVPLLRKEKDSIPSRIYIEYTVFGETPSYEEFHESHQGMKRGEMQVIHLEGYKGIRYNILSPKDDFRIYDLRNDPGETNNLAGTNDYFDELQEKMKKQVIRVRSMNANAPRPYDSIPVPSLGDVDPAGSGLQYSLYELSLPWAPDIRSLKEEPVDKGRIENLDYLPEAESNDFVLAIEGLLKVPETGKYSIEFETAGKAVIHLHEGLLFDADKGYAPGTRLDKEIFLEEGYHPVHIVYKHVPSGDKYFDLKWSGPGFELKSIEDGTLYHIEK
jgi:uncharacterized sulfatase